MPDAMNIAMFDDVSSVYDRLVDWPKRLTREAPFFLRLFETHDVRRVLDLGCGTGHHAALFYSWGLEVVGVDHSEGMLDQCRRLHGVEPRLQWARHTLAEPIGADRPFDAVVCLGNTLALAGKPDDVAAAVCAMVRSVRPGGLGVIQVFNLYALEDGPMQWQKVCGDDQARSSSLLLKGVHRSGQFGYVELMSARMFPTGVKWEARSAKFLGITGAMLALNLAASGAGVLHTLGSYEWEPFVADRSTDLIAVWRRTISETERAELT